jgi:mutator protein MutT
MKKRAFGQGKWNGIGGKPEVGEDILETAHRELQEEIGVAAKHLELVATIEFVYESKPDWDQIVSIYFCTEWESEPEETEEMKPDWFDINSLPYDNMWPDDAYWMPRVLKGEKITGKFIFNSDLNISSHELQTLNTS